MYVHSSVCICVHVCVVLVVFVYLSVYMPMSVYGHVYMQPSTQPNNTEHTVSSHSGHGRETLITFEMRCPVCFGTTLELPRREAEGPMGVVGWEQRV